MKRDVSDLVIGETELYKVTKNNMSKAAAESSIEKQSRDSVLDCQHRLVINQPNDCLNSWMFFLTIVTIKLCFTLFAVFVYSKYTPFVDSKYYLCTGSSCYHGVLPFRTECTALLFRTLKKILSFDLAVHLVISFFLGCVVWFVFKKNYQFLNKPLFYASFCLPHFMIWSGVVGKEVLAIAGALLIVGASVDLAVKKIMTWFPLIIGFSLLLSVRAHYAIAYAYLFLMTLFLTKLKSDFFNSVKTSLLTLVVSCSVVIVSLLLFWERLSAPLLSFMKRIEFNYFLGQLGARANRVDIVWSNPSDFILNLGWGLPMSMIGPTWHEIIARPLIFPAFLEGVFSLGLFLFILYKIIQCGIDNKSYHGIIILGFLPAMLIGLLLNYPFGIFNPGSAVRYKQALAALFYFYPILLMSEIKMRKFLAN